jgi:hypothetical protein
LKPFLIYLGLPRAGSTWLHGQLNARGDCNLGKGKEHFYFQGFASRSDRSVEQYWEEYKQAAKSDYIVLLGDITPSNGYATLEQLLEYKSHLDELGFQGKPVMTLRDPITQVLSMTQFQKSINSSSMTLVDGYIKSYFEGTASFNEQPLNAEVVLRDGISAFENLSTKPRRTIPTWEETISNYLTVFGEVYIQFFEEMFCEEETKLLQSWLGLEYMPMNYEQKVFSFPLPNELTTEDKKIIFNNYPRLKVNYDYAVGVWGQDKINSLWFNPYK